jgi:hypothetical protein
MVRSGIKQMQNISQVMDQVWYQVRNQDDDQVWGQVRRQVVNQVRNQVWDSFKKTQENP